MAGGNGRQRRVAQEPKKNPHDGGLFYLYSAKTLNL